MRHPADVFACCEDRLAPPGAESAWLFSGFSRELSAFDAPSLARALAEVAAAQAAGRWVLAALDYELGYVIEPAAVPPGFAPDPAQALARFWVFERRQALADADDWLAARLADLDPDLRHAGIAEAQPGLSEAAHGAAVEAIRRYIRDGDCYQVNLTFPLDFQAYGHPLALYAALRRRQPVRYGGYLALPDGGAILSLSPELFVARRGDTLVTRPMKGTAARSADAAEDARRRAGLAASEKDRAENLMIVDLLRNDLGRLAAPGSVRVDALFAIEAYPSLFQMVSQVSAEAPQARLDEILRALFPCGSITGAPKIRAMQIAAELEAGPRGLYTGALGSLAPNGDFCLNVAIRTLVLAADGRGRLGLGSGIVIDSEAAAEWRECLLKAAFLTGLDPGLRLIETLRLEVGPAGGVYPRLAGHLARLSASAAALGFACDPAAIRQALMDNAQRSAGVWRVRLTLGKRGDVDIAAAPLPPEPEGPRLLTFAAEAIDSRQPLRRHKTTVRAAYDRALAGIAARPEVFDVLFCNERGEVAEGARSNVFARIDGVWATPPLASGALPGVLRAELLARGEVVERRLLPDDLRRASELRCGNALRGWLPVRLDA